MFLDLSSLADLLGSIACSSAEISSTNAVLPQAGLAGQAQVSEGALPRGGAGMSKVARYSESPAVLGTTPANGGLTMTCA